MFLDFLASRVLLPKKLISAVMDLLNRLQLLRNREPLFDSSNKARFLSLLDNPIKRNFKSNQVFCPPTVQVFIVAAEKDFLLLDEVVHYAIKCLSEFKICSVDIVVPRQSASSETLNSIKHQFPFVRIVDENEICETDLIKQIFSTNFAGRESWCLQQFLKFYSVLNSQAEFSLVVDADTILLRKISWLDFDKRHVLMPTIEYQSQYYEVLIALGVIDSLPPFSFVPHHMFYSTSNMHLAYRKIGQPTAVDLASRIEHLSNKNLASPFCIDYELYAQFMFAHKAEKITLARWANLSLSRNLYFSLRTFPFTIHFLKLFFNSISVHSWSK